MGNFRRRLAACLRIRNETLKQCMAEFLGTLVLVAFADGSVAQAVLSKGKAGNFLSVPLAFGMAVTMGVYVSGGISGGHINPAISLAMGVIGKLKWWKVPFYCLAQYCGALAGAAAVYAVYSEAHNNFEGSNRTVPGTAGIYATYPQEFVGMTTGLIDQIVATALFLISVLAVTDKKNIGAPHGMEPFLIGLIVTAIGLGFGYNCAFAVNPARDLGPRIFTTIAGWGTAPFTFRDYKWFWIPIVGPHIGGVLGALVYVAFVSLHHEPEVDVYGVPIEGAKNGVHTDRGRVNGHGGEVNEAYSVEEFTHL